MVQATQGIVIFNINLLSSGTLSHQSQYLVKVFQNILFYAYSMFNVQTDLESRCCHL